MVVNDENHDDDVNNSHMAGRGNHLDQGATGYQSVCDAYIEEKDSVSPVFDTLKILSESKS